MSRRHVDCTRLDTEAGVVAAAVSMATACCEDALWPVLEHTPPEMRQALFERFFSALTGVMCSELGPERAAAVLAAASRAIAGVVDGQRRAH